MVTKSDRIGARSKFACEYVTRYTDLEFTGANAILFDYIFSRLYILLAKNVNVLVYCEFIQVCYYFSCT